MGLAAETISDAGQDSSFLDADICGIGFVFAIDNPKGWKTEISDWLLNGILWSSTDVFGLMLLYKEADTLAR